MSQKAFETFRSSFSPLFPKFEKRLPLESAPYRTRDTGSVEAVLESETSEVEGSKGMGGDGSGLVEVTGKDSGFLGRDQSVPEDEVRGADDGVITDHSKRSDVERNGRKDREREKDKDKGKLKERANEKVKEKEKTKEKDKPKEKEPLNEKGKDIAEKEMEKDKGKLKGKERGSEKLREREKDRDKERETERTKNKGLGRKDKEKEREKMKDGEKERKKEKKETKADGVDSEKESDREKDSGSEVKGSKEATLYDQFDPEILAYLHAIADFVTASLAILNFLPLNVRLNGTFHPRAMAAAQDFVKLRNMRRSSSGHNDNHRRSERRKVPRVFPLPFSS